MIVDFSVENFLSIKDRQTITFEPDTKVKGLEDYYFVTIADVAPNRKPLKLLKIASIYGANASGKSNVLVAVAFFKSLIEKKQVDKNENLKFEPFKMSYLHNSKMEVNFVINQTKYNYQVEFNKRVIVSEKLQVYPYLTATKSKLIYNRVTDIEKQVPIIQFNLGLKIDVLVKRELEIRTLVNETVLAGFSQISADIKALKDVKDWCRTLDVDFVAPQTPIYYYTISKLEESETLVSDVVGMLKNADFNITNLRLEKKKSGIKDIVAESMGKNISLDMKEFFSSELDVHLNSLDGGLQLSNVIVNHTASDGRFELPLSLESDGTKRYLGLIGILLYLKNKSGILVIDELETSLHPDLYEAFIVTYLKNIESSQILFTTHNREFLQKKDLIRKDSLWIANKREDASTELYSFADFDSSVIRNTTSIYNAYTVGKLGGIPNVSNDLLFIAEE